MPSVRRGFPWRPGFSLTMVSSFPNKVQAQFTSCLKMADISKIDSLLLSSQWSPTPGIGDGHGSLVCCSPWGRKELGTTERLNWTEWMTSHQWCQPAISSSDALFSFYPQSFPASGTFPVSCLFTSDNQNTGASVSASVLPVNIQGWSPVRLTGFISLLSKGLSGVSSSTTVWKHQFFGVLPSLQSNSHNCTWTLGRL